MKHQHLILPARLLLLGVCAVCQTAPALAQSAPAAVTPAELAKYDTNKNGRLDPVELDAKRAEETSAGLGGVTEADAKSPATNEVIELSPFEVRAEKNPGYYASNTLSGTRINSQIEDLAASITVVTKEQLLDTAALDINDIFLYEANTEGTGNFTEFSVGRNGDVVDSVQSSPTTANRIRGIASANIARGNFASNTVIPIDTYNVDSVEISRGPNSNIFGLGNASGTVNLIQSQANVTRDRNTVTTRADSYGGYRASFDFNRQLIHNKLAVRLLGLYDSVGYVRKPSADMTHRGQVMVLYKPFKNTAVRGSYESYHNYARRPNFTTPRDTTTFWRSVGSPTWDPVTFTAKKNGIAIGTFTQSQDATLPLGLFARGTGFYNRPGMYIDNGAVAFWTVNRTTTGSNPNSVNTNVRYMESGTDIMQLRGTTMPLFTTPGISDQSLYDWESVNYVAPNYSQKKADTYQFEVEQFIVSTPMHLLAAQAGFFREDVDNLNRNFLSGNAAILYIDVNEKLLDGSPNPYFRRTYLGASEPTTFKNPALNDNGRVQLAYQLDFGQAKTGWLHWLGRHRASGYLEGRRITSGTYRFREIVVDDHSWVNLANRANGNAIGRAYFKYYVGDSQGENIDYAPPALYGISGTYNLNWRNGTTGQWISEPATIAQSNYISNRNQREIRSRGAVLQSFWAGERIVTTVGTRRDRNRSRDSNQAVIDPTTGFYTFDPLEVWNSWSEQAGTTNTRGIVVKPLRGWSFMDHAAEQGGVAGFLADVARSTNVYYNKAQTFQPAATAYNLFGELLPSPTGDGKDYGVSFNLGSKLVVRINRYENSQTNSRGGDAGTIATRVNRLDFGNDGFNLEDISRTWISQLHPEYSAAQLDTEAYKLIQLPQSFIQNVVGKTINETQDVASKGWEFEINYNPSRNWTLKITGAQQTTIDTNLSPNIQRYIDMRMPVWTTIRNPVDNSLWWASGGDFGGPRAFYESLVAGPYKLAIANQGKPRSQVREWRWNATTSYKLAGLGIGRDWVRRTTVGGSLRWEDKGSIGYLGAAPEADGVIRSLDPDKPVYGSSNTNIDLFVSHNLNLFRDKVSTRLQLNVRNVFESGHLQTIGVNPDGQGYNFRIIDPRQFILTMTFEL